MPLDDGSQSLKDRIADLLPTDVSFNIYHLSTLPTACAAIFSPTPGAKPQKTYCESQFLGIAIDLGNSEIFAFAIEVLIYTTATLTTLFVSKADSTGYINLTNAPRSDVSPTRTISSAFVSFLVRRRQRPGIRLVVSLFARAQDQYLFPGSVEYAGKHVLDDRGLVKWWCKVLDPVLREYNCDSTIPHPIPRLERSSRTTSKGYLVVPGFDSTETRSFFPPVARLDLPSHRRWTSGHPLHEISLAPDAPPRCLIPHFPDDPKARFLDELDDEIHVTSSSQSSESPTKRAGQWRSVKSLEQFWELMAYRQECSSGRLVGFIWAVFTPTAVHVEGDDAVDSQVSLLSPTQLDGHSLPASSGSQDKDARTSRQRKGSSPFSEYSSAHSPALSPPLSPSARSHRSHCSDASRKSMSTRKKKLAGPIIPRAPRIKTTGSNLTSVQSVPEFSRYYSWPSSGRGQVVLEEKQYKRVNELLLRLNFANQSVAASSTRRWIDEVGILAGQSGAWGETVSGRRAAVPIVKQAQHSQAPNMLSVKKKRKRTEQDQVAATDGLNLLGMIPGTNVEVNVFGSCSVRKKLTPTGWEILVSSK